MKNIPILRFPDFIEDGEWEEKHVEDFFTVGSSKRVLQEEWTNKGIPFYRTRELVSLSKNESFKNEIFITEELFDELLKNYGVPTEGDFLVSGVGTLGICYQVKNTDKFYFKDGNVLWFKIEKGLNSTYFKYCFQSEHIQNQIFGQASISTVGTYTIQNAKKTKFWFPTQQSEQQKIASCLSTLDEVISASVEKLALLKAHKKGLMQQLFPQAGEKVPRLRFPEFVGNGEWEEKHVEDFFTVGSSKRVLQEEWTNKGIPFYRTRELVSLSKNESFKNEIFITEELFDELFKNYGVPTEGDFLVSGVGTLGICYQVKNTDKFYFKDGNVLWFKIEKGLNSTYFKYCFQSEHIQNQILGQASISTVGTYTIQNAKKTKFWFPTQQPEQQKIASCLSSLDDLIQAQTEQVAALRLHKKGLMQGLFPQGET